ncbi:MAG: hypothetical protein IPP48_13250 [Chitinophagaceae bacterium]|nr:hypothetical protein [Chitinophagaceae bacterium]
MNIKQLHLTDKAVSAIPFFKTENSNVVALQILKGEKLKEHVTPIHAILICITGVVYFENEKGEKVILNHGDYINIEPLVKHWVTGIEESQLLLLK